jgi:6-pyruvoyltetrahydropterin/6-carboxytetrahydropterin synthase
MDGRFQITREIAIDAGHRIPNHHSKCRNLHGHRYVIQATLHGDVATSGSVEGMAGGMDFGFLKEEMLKTIDAGCDHALILYEKDPLLEKLLQIDVWTPEMNTQGYCIFLADQTICGKIYVIDRVPTAENLAFHWYGRLAPRVLARSNGAAWLMKLRVYETTNCYAEVGE